MKRLLIASTIIALSSNCFAEEPVKFFNEKNYSTGDAKGGAYIQGERTIGTVEKKGSHAIGCFAKTHRSEGKVNDFIQIDGKHGVSAYNDSGSTCRGHLRYEIRSEGASFIHESDFQMQPGASFADKGTTITGVQKKKSGTWKIFAFTGVGSINCGSASDHDQARLIVH